MEKYGVSKMKKVLKRSETNPKYCWNMTDMYAEDNLWEKDYEDIMEKISTLESYNAKDTSSFTETSDLLAVLELATSISQKLEKIYVYANQKLHEDMGNGKYQDMASRAELLSVKNESAASFVQPMIMKLGRKKLKEMTKLDKRLEFYDRYFEIILRQSDHILEPEKEQLLAQAGELGSCASDIFGLFNNVDISFPDITDENGNKTELTHGRYISFLQSKDRRIREEAFMNLYHTYDKFKNTLAATYRANAKQHAFFAKARNYSGGMEYSLADSNVPVSVYNCLIDSVHHYLPLLHRYVTLRKNILGVSELHMYDLYVPMVSEVNMKISFEEAKTIVKEALAPLGSEYQKLLQKGFDGGWIDVYENEGKRSGAYSWGAYGIHPYVLLNHQDNLNSVFTLAHEMGHALHSYYSDANQPYIYAGYKIFVAEVASTCNESLLVHYLLDKCTDTNEKKYLINYFLEQFRTTFFRQTMFAEFEKITHEKCQNGESLTADVLCDIYKKLNEDYFGKDAYVDEEIALEWARIPHFYTPFYVYQYATGFAAAIAISGAILEGNTKVLTGYKKFLSSGGSMDPIDLLRLCGVDMMTEEPVASAMKVFEQLLDTMMTSWED